MSGREESKPSNADIRAGLQAVFPRLKRYALTLTGCRSDAEDIAQSACLRAMERSYQLDHGAHLDRWVFRIAHNLWISEIRRKKTRSGNGLVSIECQDIMDPAQDPHQDLKRRELLQSILHLPEAQRQAVVLVYVEGYSYRDATMIVDIPVGTLMSRLAAARTTLVRKLRDHREVSRAR